MRSAVSTLRSPILLALVVIVIGLVLTAPLLQGDTLCTDDGALHVFRTVALDRAIRDGLLFPRWFPDLAYGYGFPFFVYREPLGYYALEALHLLGISVPNAFNLTLAGSVALSGLAMFWLAGDLFGERGGLMAGAAYVTAPYTLIGPITRGNLPEVMAFALMPLILFFFRRLVVFRQTRYFAASIASYAALFLTHNISSLLFTPLLLAYLVVLALARAENSDGPRLISRRSPIGRIRHAMRDMRYAIAAVALAFGLTAFFWLPALAEQDEAQLYLTHSTRGNNYNYNFIGLGELLGGPGRSDPNLLNPPLRISFGWPQLALAALGALSIRRASNREQRALIAGAALAALALTFMALPASKPLWDSLPLIRFVQFPWRFVGRAMLPMALLAAAVFVSPGKAQRTQSEQAKSTVHPAVSSLAYGAVVFIALLFTAPMAYPRTCATPHDLDINDVFGYERATGHIGVDPLGAYLPRTVIERPSGSPLEAQYAAGQTVERFDASTLPDGARVTEARYGPNRADLRLSTPTAFTATYRAFAFPGWQVRIDDRPVEIRPSDPTGLITFDVPAGEHRIHVEFGSSLQRTAADGLSLIASFATIAMVVIQSRSNRNRTVDGTGQAAQDARLTSRLALHTFLALAAFLLVKATLIDASLTPLRGSRLHGETLAGVAYPADVTFGDRLRLLGFDMTPSEAQPGDLLRVDLYWQAVRPLDAAYQAEAVLADADGRLWSPKHAERPRDFTDYPTTPQWPAEAYAIDSFEVEVLPGTPPGAYALAAQVFDRATLAALGPSAAPVPGGRAAPIGSIRVDRATRAFSAEQLRIYGGERHDLDADVTILGYNIDRAESVPGESVLLTFFWQADHAPQVDRRFRVELLGAADAAMASQDILIGGADYPTSRWSAGEQIISPLTLRVPAAAPTGAYRWRASLLDSAGRPADAFDLQPPLRVTAPERTFDVPDMGNRLSAELGGFAALLGFDLASDRLAAGGSIDLTLYWQARAETETAYKVFVHVLDAGGGIAAQGDAVPVSGRRPTTGWLPGEVIADRHSITLPADLTAGTYSLAVGMYDPQNDVRLKTRDGGAVITLADIEAR